MNKSRGLTSRSILNTSRGLITDNRGIKKDYDRALKDIKEINFYNSYLYDYDDNSKLIPSTNVKNEPNILEEIGLIETKVSDVDLFELNLVSNIPIEESPIEESPIEEYNMPSLSPNIQSVSFETGDEPQSGDSIDENDTESSIVRADEDDEETEMNQIKEENYNKFIEDYQEIIEGADFSDDFYEKNKDIFNDKLKDIKNSNQIKNYSIGEMIDLMKETLINIVTYEIKKIKESMVKIEKRKDYKDKNYTKKDFILKSNTYRDYDEKLTRLDVNKQNIERLSRIIITYNETGKKPDK